MVTPEQIEDLVEKVAERTNERNRESMRAILKSMKPQKLLSSKEAAERLHVTTKCLLDWKKSGRLVPLSKSVGAIAAKKKR